MRVEFIGDTDTAMVTRGLFRRKAAMLVRTQGQFGYNWIFESTSRICDYDLSVALDRARKKEIERQQDEAEWITVRMPQAKSVLR